MSKYRKYRKILFFQKVQYSLILPLLVITYFYSSIVNIYNKIYYPHLFYFPKLIYIIPIFERINNTIKKTKIVELYNNKKYFY